MGSISASRSLLRSLCWALIVFVIASAILTIGTNPSLGLLVHNPDTSNTPDLVDRLALILAANQQAQPLFLLSNLLGVGVFALATVLGVALRPFAASGSARDVMATVFILGGVVGVIGQLTLIGVNQMAAQGYCDCGYKAEELIAQSKALDLGFAIQNWLAIAALTTVGLAAALAGRQLDVSPAWRTLSYGIAIALIIAAVLQIIGQGDYAQILTGITAGVFVTIWAIMLARATSRLGGDSAAPAAA